MVSLSLAMAFGCIKFYQYIFERHVLVESDYKHFSLFPKAALQNTIHAVYIAQPYGLFLADNLSQAHLSDTTEKLVPDMISFLHASISPEQYKRL
jgi:hypothetical protein